MAAAAALRRVRVWDLPQRVAHALMAVSFAVAWLTAEADGWFALHWAAGWTLTALVLWRVGWGFIGTPHARFASFVKGPAAVVRHLAGLLARPAATVEAGHNPAGGWAVLALLGLALAAALSGAALDAGWFAALGGDAGEDLHEALAEALLALAGLHVAAVVVTGWRQRRNLARAMLDGHQRVPAAHAGPDVPRRAAAAMVLLALVAGGWAWHAERWRSGAFDAAHRPSRAAAAGDDGHRDAHGRASSAHDRHHGSGHDGDGDGDD